MTAELAHGSAFAPHTIDVTTLIDDSKIGAF